MSNWAVEATFLAFTTLSLLMVGHCWRKARKNKKKFLNELYDYYTKFYFVKFFVVIIGIRGPLGIILRLAPNTSPQLVELIYFAGLLGAVCIVVLYLDLRK